MRRNVASLVFVVSFIGCNPYDRFGHLDQFNLGAVDALNFPAEYLGDGGDKLNSGGVFTPKAATVDGAPVFYFLFSSADQPTLDPAATPLAYVFDPGATDPYPAKYACKAPADYVYDQQRDTLPFTEQGDIITALPDADSYVPIVLQTSVASGPNYPCQKLKAEEDLLTSTEVTVKVQPADPKVPNSVASGIADSPNRYLVWVGIDPGATVYFDDQMTLNTYHLGPQKWGYYNGYLAAWLDGGYLPTENVTTTNPKTMVMTTSTVGHAQKLYVPDSVPTAMGAETLSKEDMMPVAGRPGQGYDVLEAKRDAQGYSPLCQVFTYSVDPMAPVFYESVAEIEATQVAATAMTPGITDTGTYIYCLQVK